MKGIFQPLYVGDPKWETVFLLPSAAFKVWMLHYSMEQQRRRSSWPSIETICTSTGLNRKTVFAARSWLVKNGWLIKVGSVPSGKGMPVPVFRVERGTLESPKTVPNNVPKRGTYNVPKSGTEVSTEKRDKNQSNPESEKSESEQFLVSKLVGYTTAWGKEKFKLVYESLSETLHEPFGLPYISVLHSPAIADIADSTLLHGLAPAQVCDLASWAKRHKFWSGVTPTINSLAKHMLSQDEKGIVAQYRVYVTQRKHKEPSAGRAGTHAALNPELHTGLDGDGNSLTGKVTKI